MKFEIKTQEKEKVGKFLQEFVEELQNERKKSVKAKIAGVDAFFTETKEGFILILSMRIELPKSKSLIKPKLEEKLKLIDPNIIIE